MQMSGIKSLFSTQTYDYKAVQKPGSMVGGQARSGDTISISPEAMDMMNAMLGVKTPGEKQEPKGMNKLMLDTLQELKGNALKEGGEYTNESELLPQNYEMLKAIETEIALGNDSKELQQRKLLIQLFGDKQVLTEQDFKEGMKILDEISLGDESTLAFADIVSLLRRAAGLGGEGGNVDEEGEDEKVVSGETKQVLEALEQFLHDTQGASVNIRLVDDRKEIHVKLGPQDGGAQVFAWNLDASMPELQRELKERGVIE